MKESNCFEKIVRGSTLVFLILIGLAVFVLGSSVQAAPPDVGSGTLTLNPVGMGNPCDPAGSGFMDFDNPHFWDWYQNDAVWIHIAPGYSICTAGAPDNINDRCTADAGCNDTDGTCNNGTGTCGSGTCNASTHVCQFANTVSCTTSAECANICRSNSSANANGSCTTSFQCQTHMCSANSPKSGDSCVTNDDCHYLNGSCDSALECADNTNLVIMGHTGNACNVDGDCTGNGETGCDGGQTCTVGGTCLSTGETCTDVSDCPKTGLCKFEDTVTTTGRMGNGAIDVCYHTRENTCSGADMAYCTGTCIAGDPPRHCSNNAVKVCQEDSDCEFIPNFQQAGGMGQVFMGISLRTVAENDDEACTMDSECGNELLGISGTCVNGDCEVLLETSEACTPPMSDTCMNVVGSQCCGLTQGAYGSPNSVATAAGTGTCGDNDNPLTGAGFIPAAICEGCDPFNSGACPNGTTIGLTGNSVSILDLATLITWLPTGGTAGQLKSSPYGDKCYPTTPFYNGDLTGGGSKGAGGGVLSGQTMGGELNTFLSNCMPPFGGSTVFTTTGFEGFQLPGMGELVCTKRSGPNKVLGTDDDICQAFGYPNCVAGLTVQQVLDCANHQLYDGTNTCGCTATELNNALNNINYEFDQCGVVVECPDAVTSAGTFDCTLLQ